MVVEFDGKKWMGWESVEMGLYMACVTSMCINMSSEVGNKVDVAKGESHGSCCKKERRAP